MLSPENNTSQSPSRIYNYDINGLVVSMGDKEYTPFQKKHNPSNAINTMSPGWAMPHLAYPTYKAWGIDRLDQAISNSLGESVHGLAPEIDRNPHGSLLMQGEALANHVLSLVSSHNNKAEEQGSNSKVDRVRLGGYSEGGMIALLAGHFIQQSAPELRTAVIGVLPVGMHDHGKGAVGAVNLARHFVMDAGIVSALDLKNIVSVLHSGKDLSSGLLHEVRGKLTQYPQRLWTQILEMATLNLVLDEYRGDYGIIQAAGDTASNPKKALDYNNNTDTDQLKFALRKRMPNANLLNAMVLPGHHPLPINDPELIGNVMSTMYHQFDEMR